MDKRTVIFCPICREAYIVYSSLEIPRDLSFVCYECWSNLTIEERLISCQLYMLLRNMDSNLLRSKIVVELGLLRRHVYYRSLLKTKEGSYNFQQDLLDELQIVTLVEDYRLDLLRIL